MKFWTLPDGVSSSAAARTDTEQVDCTVNNMPRKLRVRSREMSKTLVPVAYEDMKEGDLVAFVGCHILAWERLKRDYGIPDWEYAFVEADAPAPADPDALSAFIEAADAVAEMARDGWRVTDSEDGILTNGLILIDD